ncbi:histidine kinase [Vibrio sp. 10N.286.49.C2]|uniref:sensor histidine kinase n=1 Tax=unclassified Vibrio TaxID=2614977 RepID=UPI000C81FB26|nr:MULTISPECIES: ATP-binding protein [unclassified Vibrio]PMH31505.1 histidine kinase [Vibrio sp. 10N.286.49.C2]PMH50526.1 histidine kinase [Vibrio sp. 10N.286.49.B1]PMH77992.1 histidine kinase [Vibrio sp. 10N.286.48.B7]
MNELIEHYFSNPKRQISLKAGDIVLRQNGLNDRLYYVQSGELEGFFEREEDGNLTKLFTASHGAFIGVHSFFSGTWTASSTVKARTDVKLAWVDRHTAAIRPETLGPLNSQFMPVIVNELSRRQRRATQEALAKEKVLQRLHTAEQMTTLGQLAAGIAHELNNAIGVVSSKTERLQSELVQLLEEAHPDSSQYFDIGLMQGQSTSSSDARKIAKTIESKYKLDRTVAKRLSKALGSADVPQTWLKEPKQAIKYWELGRDLHDLRLAARHTVGIVKSVKQLGRTDNEQDELIDINDTVNKALSLLQSDLRLVSVRLRPATLPLIKGASTEYVQIWSNIIKNACDAMRATPKPEIEIQTRWVNQRILVTISNNGPEIDQSIRRKIFQPNFTTKKGGLSFGLGLGLSIVKRIVSENGGTVVVKSSQEQTIFRVKLPVGEANGEA